MPQKNKILLSWIAHQNDPYERNRDRSYVVIDGERIWGPTLSILFDSASIYKNVEHIILFYRIPPNGIGTEVEYQVMEETIEEIQKISSRKINVELKKWISDDPTDHLQIFNFLGGHLPEIRKKNPDSELIIHLSPGTPSMQTIWILMAEMGFIKPPFKVVKSYRKKECKNGEMIVPVHIGIETFYKVYDVSRPSIDKINTESLFWDPSLFCSSKIKEVYKQARRFAKLNIPVLLLGERGTGKTTLASWIRSSSSYRKQKMDGKWPSIVCGQYTTEMMRAELFGYKKGAFTGAVVNYDGLIKTADGDTLFLDEIGDISKDLQRLLIRVLEERTFLPLGETTAQNSNFRLITATNRPMSQLAEILDEDFLDRIGSLCIHLPALREMPEDIPWIWRNVWQIAQKKSGVIVYPRAEKKVNHASIVQSLQKHLLPGNLRDLFKLAYQIIAIVTDEEEPVTQEEIANLVIDILSTNQKREEGILLAIANALTKKQSLDHVMLADGTIFSTKQVEREFKNYIANEIRRIAKLHQIPIESFCDVTERTILNWSK